MTALANRLRNVRVACGDWLRVCGSETTTVKLGACGVFLDPPYSAEAGRDIDLYREEDLSVAHRVRDWCREYGPKPDMRIALCGYEGEHDDLEAAGWDVFAWKAGGGYANLSDNGNGLENRKRERIWFSPGCISELREGLMFGA